MLHKFKFIDKADSFNALLTLLHKEKKENGKYTIHIDHIERIERHISYMKGNY